MFLNSSKTTKLTKRTDNKVYIGRALEQNLLNALLTWLNMKPFTLLDNCLGCISKFLKCAVLWAISFNFVCMFIYRDSVVQQEGLGDKKTTTGILSFQKT